LSKWTVACLSALTINAAYGRADVAACADKQQDKTYIGTVEAVDANDHILKVHGLVFSREFNLGDRCGYTFLDSRPGTIAELSPGQKVAVEYRKIDGVRVADAVEQQPMMFEGTVKDIDPQKHTMAVGHLGLEKTFQIPGNCPVELFNRHGGKIDDVKVGNHVSVMYETPRDEIVARRIVQTGEVFTGALTAIDLNNRTAKAKDILASKDFAIAPGCTVVLDGNGHSSLRDVRLGQLLEFDYTDANGVKIVNRIAAVPQTPSRVTASAGSPHESQMPGAPSDY